MSLCRPTRRDVSPGRLRFAERRSRLPGNHVNVLIRTTVRRFRQLGLDFLLNDRAGRRSRLPGYISNLWSHTSKRRHRLLGQNSHALTGLAERRSRLLGRRINRSGRLAPSFAQGATLGHTLLGHGRQSVRLLPPKTLERRAAAATRRLRTIESHRVGDLFARLDPEVGITQGSCRCRGTVFGIRPFEAL